jgi:hypothetical protein
VLARGLLSHRFDYISPSPLFLKLEVQNALAVWPKWSSISIIIDCVEHRDTIAPQLAIVSAAAHRQAQKNRQVILMTHNPDLAVGADAQQIIGISNEHEAGAPIPQAWCERCPHLYVEVQVGCHGRA